MTQLRTSPIRLTHVHAREVLDSRGFPTVEVEVGSAEHRARAIVPSGASTGEGEALELRDGDRKRFGGKGVRKAVDNVHSHLAPALVGREFALQSVLDDTLCDLDGTANKSKLGANALLGVSMAFARLLAMHQGASLYRSLALVSETPGVTLPVPLMNVINGGKHADSGLDIQEFMIVPHGLGTFSEALRAGVEIFQRLKKILTERGLSTGVGDEGGFAPKLIGQGAHEQALGYLVEAIQESGYALGKQVSLALDCAASEFVTPKQPGSYEFEGKRVSSRELIAIYQDWLGRYPIVSIEDGLSEHDWEGWAWMTQTLGQRVQCVGDDLFVTNPTTLKKGIDARVANSILIKLNQIGTVTETLETIRLARQSGYTQIASHRSGETEDTFIADLAVGSDCGQIKTGSLCRTDRIAKYNQLLRIEEELGQRALFAGSRAFKAH